ncbi:MAG: sigma-54-dependent transcriptional regulator, partial [Bacteroidota bacterium]
SDIRMPGMDGLTALEKIKAIEKNSAVIIITAHDDMQSTIKAIQLGAYDYIEKPLEIERLLVTVRRALDAQRMSERLDALISESSGQYQLDNVLIGRTPAMREIYKKIGSVSSSKVTVLIQGESGTGKELIARAIHYNSRERNEPFIAVNCTALSETLLESELFGHVKGAFTGATGDKRGKFELAGEGTVFLDEIGEMSPHLQVKILRVLQEREFERVGGEKTIPMNARVIAATNRNLTKLVQEGKFRDDLYYRLNVVTIDVPPLRKRKEDIPLLVEHFLREINTELHRSVMKMPSEVMELLVSHSWPGSVRELKNVLTQAIVLSPGDVLLKENILLQRASLHTPPEEDASQMSLAEMERRQIKRVLDSVGWDKAKALEILGISKPTLYKKIERYDLKPD